MQNEANDFVRILMQLSGTPVIITQVWIVDQTLSTGIFKIIIYWKSMCQSLYGVLGIED